MISKLRVKTKLSKTTVPKHKLTSHDETGEYTYTRNDFTTRASVDEVIGV